MFNQDRLPRAFEVLDGSIPCSAERMDLFLHRVQAFPTCRFVVLHAEKLDSKNLEALLLFLSDRKIAFLGFALHCVQFGDTLIHTSPWVEGKTWDSSVLAQALDYWAPFVTNKVAVSVVSTPLCGTGKTRLIREEMSKFESGGLGRSTASIVIHEASSISSLVRSLRRNTGGAVGPCALHLSVAATPQHTKANDEWLRSINHFFFSLLALGSVFDSVSATSFNLPEVEWMIMLELPEELCSNSAFDWLSIHVPIIALCATFLSPSEAYVIDEEARRVCTYLRAYSDGTINRKFEKGSNKRIVLALDCSGSMEGTPYQDVTNNAVGILDSHVVEGDVSCRDSTGCCLFANGANMMSPSHF